LENDKKWTLTCSGGIVIDIYLIGNDFNQVLLVRKNGAGALREAVQFNRQCLPLNLASTAHLAIALGF
jgi:hypothetical protein